MMIGEPIKPTCSFCTPDVETIQEIIRNEAVRVIYPRGPIIPQHLMFVPLRHVEEVSELTQNEASAFIQAYGSFKKALFEKDGVTGANVFVNDGSAAGQHVPHVHFHMFGRSVNEPISPYTIINNLDENPVEQLSDKTIRDRANEMRKAVQKYW